MSNYKYSSIDSISILEPLSLAVVFLNVNVDFSVKTGFCGLVTKCVVNVELSGRCRNG